MCLFKSPKPPPAPPRPPSPEDAAIARRNEQYRRQAKAGIQSTLLTGDLRTGEETIGQKWLLGQ